MFTALVISRGMRSARAKSFVVPIGISPTFGRFSKPLIPATTSFNVPSPPAATTRSKPRSTASLAASTASPSQVVAWHDVS